MCVRDFYDAQQFFGRLIFAVCLLSLLVSIRAIYGCFVLDSGTLIFSISLALEIQSDRVSCAVLKGDNFSVVVGLTLPDHYAGLVKFPD